MESQKTGQSRDLEGRLQRKLHFSGHKKPTESGPDQITGLGNQEKPTQVSAMQRAGLGSQEKIPHKHLPSKLWPSGQGATREEKHWQRFQGQVESW